MPNTREPSPRHIAPTSEELLRLVVESATDIAIIAVDSTGIVTSWNVGAERLLGWTEEDILGHSGDVIFTPDDRAAGYPEEERIRAHADGRAEDERWHQRKDGSRFWGSGLLMPLRGETVGFAKIMRDRTEQHRAGERLRESEERFRKLATSIPQLVFGTRGNGARTWGSPQWEVFTGLSDAQSREFGWLDAVHPDDRATTLEAWRRSEETGDYYVEHRIRRIVDGEYRWHQTRASPIREDGQEVTEWVGTSADIHEIRGLQERQKILLAELQHRTRNLLAVVQALARQTLRSSTTLNEFTAEYEDRLRALSRVQSLLAGAAATALDLRNLVDAELKAHGGRASEGVQVEGPSVELPLASVQTLALALHELATNAVKYGALGQSGGRLTVKWRVEGSHGQQRRVALEWRESGVVMPDGASARRKGYGSELIERALPYQLNAVTRFEFGGDGVRCFITVPLGKMSKEAKYG